MTKLRECLLLNPEEEVLLKNQKLTTELSYLRKKRIKNKISLNLQLNSGMKYASDFQNPETFGFLEESRLNIFAIRAGRN